MRHHRGDSSATPSTPGGGAAPPVLHASLLGLAGDVDTRQLRVPLDASRCTVHAAVSDAGPRAPGTLLITREGGAVFVTIADGSGAMLLRYQAAAAAAHGEAGAPKRRGGDAASAGATLAVHVARQIEANPFPNAPTLLEWLLPPTAAGFYNALLVVPSLDAAAAAGAAGLEAQHEDVVPTPMAGTIAEAMMRSELAGTGVTSMSDDHEHLACPVCSGAVQAWADDATFGAFGGSRVAALVPELAIAADVALARRVLADVTAGLPVAAAAVGGHATPPAADDSGGSGGGGGMRDMLVRMESLSIHGVPGAGAGAGVGVPGSGSR